MILIFLSLLLTSGVTQVFSLWPIPHSLQTGTSFLKLAQSFDINLDGIQSAPDDLRDAVSRTKVHLKNDKLERLVVGRGADDHNSLENAPSLSTLQLSLSSSGPSYVAPKSILEEATKPIGTRIEGYTLSIPGTGGTATITANSTLGLLRGLTTFEQLFYFHGDHIYTFQAPVQITDSPDYPYRGFMLDTSRNFFPVDDIKRTLDAMSMVKMSQFHWHVVDSQSFPLYIPGYPELSEKGAYSSKQIYSTDDVNEIVHYAGVRGIDVLMEIDTPGHTSIISASHPEHIACAGSTPWSKFAASPPPGQLRITSSATANFTAGFLSAIAKTLPSTLFSTGGDEINQDCYKEDPKTREDLVASGKTLEQALDSFTQTTHGALKKIGKTPAVWEEMVLDHNVALSNDTIVKVWISSQNAASVVEKGFRIVHAASDYFYLDCGHGGWLGNSPNGNSWCDPFKTWQKAYNFNPQANISTASSNLVLGGQQLLWTEQSDPSNLDSIVWPRAAASAEVFWTGDSNPRNAKSALPRLHDLRYRMVQRGIKAIPLQPHWCALRPGYCDLDATT